MYMILHLHILQLPEYIRIQWVAYIVILREERFPSIALFHLFQICVKCLIKLVFGHC